MGKKQLCHKNDWIERVKVFLNVARVTSGFDTCQIGVMGMLKKLISINCQNALSGRK